MVASRVVTPRMSIRARLATGRGPFGGASATRSDATSPANPLIVALFALCGLVLWRLPDRGGRRMPPVRPVDRLGIAPSTVEGRRTQGRRELRRGAAMFLAAFLLAPASAPAQTTTQVVEFYATDALGSVRTVTKQVNGEWTVVNRNDFVPFGEAVAPPPPPPSYRSLFTGKERDSETGLDYFGARYYRADLGRFTTIDPVSITPERLLNPQRLNRYAYAINNPLRYVDPKGARHHHLRSAGPRDRPGQAEQMAQLLARGILTISRRVERPTTLRAH